MSSKTEEYLVLAQRTANGLTRYWESWTDYPDYRKARNEMQELVWAQKNIEQFFAEEKDTTEKTQTR